MLGCLLSFQSYACTDHGWFSLGGKKWVCVRVEWEGEGERSRA